MKSTMIENTEHLAGIGGGRGGTIGSHGYEHCYSCAKFKHQGECTDPSHWPNNPVNGCECHEPKAAAPGVGAGHSHCSECPHGRWAGGQGMDKCRPDPLIEFKATSPCICHHPGCQP